MTPQEHNKKLKIKLQEYVDGCIKAAYKTDSMDQFNRLVEVAINYTEQIQEIENFNNNQI